MFIHKNTLINYSCIITASALWGSTFALLVVASESFHAIAITWWRVALGALVLYAFVRTQGIPLPTRLDIWAKFAVLGLFICAIPFACVSYAVQYTNASTVGLAMATIPLFSTIIGTLTGYMKSTGWQHYFGIIIGFIGIYVLIGFDTEGLDFNNKWGVILSIVSALCYSISMIINKKLQGIVHSHLQTFLPFCWGSLFLLPMVYMNDVSLVPQTIPTFESIVALMTLAIFPTVIARMLALFVLIRTNPSFASLSGYLVPISSTIIGFWILGDTLSTNFWIAFMCVITSIWLCRPPHTHHKKG